MCGPPPAPVPSTTDAPDVRERDALAHPAQHVVIACSSCPTGRVNEDTGTSTQGTCIAARIRREAPPCKPIPLTAWKPHPAAPYLCLLRVVRSTPGNVVEGHFLTESWAILTAQRPAATTSSPGAAASPPHPAAAAAAAPPRPWPPPPRTIPLPSWTAARYAAHPGGCPASASSPAPAPGPPRAAIAAAARRSGWRVPARWPRRPTRVAPGGAGSAA